MEKIVLHVEGMVCGHCEIAIMDAVRKLPGIKKVKASRRKKQVTAEYDPSLATPDGIMTAIGSTGYRVVV